MSDSPPASANCAVFLSYASQDAEAAQRICDTLRTVGIEVWFDQSDLVGGDAWDQKIRKQVAECPLFVPIISAHTEARLEGYFRIEWKLAAQRTHAMADEKAFLLPVVIDATRDTEAKVPVEFKAVQWTKLPAGETGEAFCQRVKKLLGGEAPSVEGPRQEVSAASRVGSASPPRKLWLLGAIVGFVAMGTVLVWRPWRVSESRPSNGDAAAAEVARLRAALSPDEWTRADFDALTPTIDRLIQANPESGGAWALQSIANSLLVIRNLDSGTVPLEAGGKAADRASRLAPDSPLAELSLGMHLTAMISRGSDVRAPRVHTDHGVAGAPVDTLARYAELVSYWLGYQFEGTERSARAWLAAEPGASFPVWILAQSYLAQRRPEEALKSSEQSARDPDITGVRSYVTMFEARYYLQADLGAARATLDRIPIGQRGEHRVVASRWLLAMAEKRYDQALQELAQAPGAMLLDRVYHGPKALLAAFAHEAAGRPEVARAQFLESERVLRKELAQDTDNQELRAVLALNLACLGRPDDARHELAAVEPLLHGQDPSVYTGQVIALIAQTHGVLGEINPMTAWLRRLFTEPSTLPFSPASLRIDPRFGRYASNAQVQALLTEFSNLDPTSSLPADQKSVAVLAFANLSDDKDNEYFSDGISEELLNVLAKIPGLKVTARTSAFYFKGRQVPIAEIAKQLGVAYIVEGSVRKAGLRVRIGARLIKADDGFQVWSDDFDRELKDIFAVQDEIAGLIAKNLQLKLGASSAVSTIAVNPQAFEAYLQGRQAWNRRNREGYQQATTSFKRAIELDPSFARAYVGLADVLDVEGWDEGGVGRWDQRNSKVIGQIHSLLERAVALDPDLAEAHASLGSSLYDAWDYPAALSEARRAMELNPNYATGWHWLGLMLWDRGQMDEALTDLHRAADLDPFSLAIAAAYSLCLRDSGRPLEALAVAERAVNLQSGTPRALGAQALALLDLGRTDEAARIARELVDSEDGREWWQTGVIAARAGLQDEAAKLLEQYRKAGNERLEAPLFALLGRWDEFLAVWQRRPMVTNQPWYLWEPSLDPMRGNPKFLQVLDQVGMTEAHARVQAWRKSHPLEKPTGR